MATVENNNPLLVDSNDRPYMSDAGPPSGAASQSRPVHAANGQNLIAAGNTASVVPTYGRYDSVANFLDAQSPTKRGHVYVSPADRFADAATNANEQTLEYTLHADVDQGQPPPALTPPQKLGLCGRIKRSMCRHPKTWGSTLLGAATGVTGAAVLMAMGKGALIGTGVGTACVPLVGTFAGAAIGAFIGALVGACSVGGAALLVSLIGNCVMKRRRASRAPSLDQQISQAIAAVQRNPPRYESLLNGQPINPALSREDRQFLRNTVTKIVEQDLTARRAMGLPNPTPAQLQANLHNCADLAYLTMCRATEIRFPPGDRGGEEVLAATKDEAIVAASDYMRALVDPGSTPDDVAETGVQLSTAMRWYTTAAYRYDHKFKNAPRNSDTGFEMFKPVIAAGKAHAANDPSNPNGAHVRNIRSWRRRALLQKRQPMQQTDDAAVAIWFAALNLATHIPTTNDSHRQEASVFQTWHQGMKFVLATLSGNRFMDVSNHFETRERQERTPQGRALNLAICPANRRQEATEALLGHIPQYEAARLACHYRSDDYDSPANTTASSQVGSHQPTPEVHVNSLESS